MTLSPIASCVICRRFSFQVSYTGTASRGVHSRYTQPSNGQAFQSKYGRSGRATAFDSAAPGDAFQKRKMTTENIRAILWLAERPFSAPLPLTTPGVPSFTLRDAAHPTARNAAYIATAATGANAIPDGPQASRTTSIVTLRRARVAASPSRSHSA